MMTTDQSKKLIQEYVQAISLDKSEATIDKYIADPELKGHIILFEAGLPNYQIIAKDMIVEGNKVVLRGTVKGEHKGELFGIAPTGREVNVDLIIIYELENNKVVNHWMQADTVALMQQIGNSPVAASAH
ncbi:ester cyclase [Pontibacter pamirensis]|uniref:ester cyclase n=1 Tax=Pontibacter pamirensis TaxID=2562824 RepID=UPI00138993AC|nr:ester cyclase [Pontibacter pamirensis]